MMCMTRRLQTHLHTMLRSKIVTDASVLITFNIAVMLNLNDRVSDDAISRLAARRHDCLAN